MIPFRFAGERYVYKFVCDPEVVTNVAMTSDSSKMNDDAHRRATDVPRQQPWPTRGEATTSGNRDYGSYPLHHSDYVASISVESC